VIGQEQRDRHADVQVANRPHERANAALLDDHAFFDELRQPAADRLMVHLEFASEANFGGDALAGLHARADDPSEDRVAGEGGFDAHSDVP
jgi:hypothetical protein